MSFLKRVAARLPAYWQDELKRLHFRRQIRANRFSTEEPEFRILDTIVKPGDWVIDIGANVGHYTKRFSELVGGTGRVIAIEPIPATFSLLAANIRLLPEENVTILNVAASEATAMLRMQIPMFAHGLTNYYQAQVTEDTSSDLPSTYVLGISVDSLRLQNRIRLVKIDAEGHEEHVLDGMPELVRAHRPHLIIEGDSRAIELRLGALGYVAKRLSNSPNTYFVPE